jgi:hypothetical protein
MGRVAHTNGGLLRYDGICRGSPRAGLGVHNNVNSTNKKEQEGVKFFHGDLFFGKLKTIKKKDPVTEYRKLFHSFNHKSI